VVPGEAATIQSAIDQAEDGDTVLVLPGTYSGKGNRDLLVLSKDIVILSLAGPAETIIDCGGSAEQEHWGIQFLGLTDNAILDGFTIRNGYYNSGSAILIHSGSPTIRNTILVNNAATITGGAIRCKGNSPRFENCTIVHNKAPLGAGAWAIGTASPEFVNCLIAAQQVGEAVATADGSSQPVLECCNLFANEGGNWVDAIVSQGGVNGNLSEDPKFCGDIALGDVHVQAESVCLPQNNDCGVRIGALGLCEKVGSDGTAGP
jgi:hypothetical protein